MKTFVAYRFTGEDPKALEPLQIAIRDAFSQKGVNAYSTFFDEAEFQDKSFNPRQIMEHAFKVIDGIDFLFVLITSDSKSEGMLIEVGYCIAKGIPVIVAIKDTAGSTYLPSLADYSFRWSNTEELVDSIAKIKPPSGG